MKNFIYFILLWPSSAFSVCLDLIKGPIVIETSACIDANPAVGSPSYKAFPEWVHTLDVSVKNKVLSGHQGILIKGKVTDSQVTPVNEAEIGKDVKGQEIKVFIHSAQGLTCTNAAKKLIQGFLQESCCDTGSQVPCLWDTPYFMRSPKPIVKNSLAPKPQAGRDKISKVSSIAKKTPEKSAALSERPALAIANDLYLAGKFQDVVKLLYEHWPDNINNPQWIWVLTQSLRQLDLCTKAIKPLEQMNELYEKGELSLQNENKTADSVFLLARCYAKTGKREEAVNVLQGMLYKKQLFKKYLALSRSHPDLSNLQSLPSFQSFLMKQSEEP